MWKYLIYKEWLKLRWITWGAVALSLATGIYMMLELRHFNNVFSERNTWYSLVYQDDQFYQILNFLPLLIGIGFPLLQFLPEIYQKRLKLTFHLPLVPVHSIFIMTFFGTALMLASMLVPLGFILLTTTFFFHFSVIAPLSLSLLPIILGSTICYSATVSILLEPSGKIKIYLFIVLFLSALFPFSKTMFEGMNINLIPILMVAALWHMSLYFTAIRFAKIITN